MTKRRCTGDDLQEIAEFLHEACTLTNGIQEEKKLKFFAEG